MKGLAAAPRLGELVFAQPFLILAAGALILLCAVAFTRGPRRRWIMPTAAGVCLAALAAAIQIDRLLGPGGSRDLMFGMLVADRFAVFMTAVLMTSALLCLLLSAAFMAEHRQELGEHYPLVLLAAAGMVMLTMASDLVTVFLGLETMSLSAYVLTGSSRTPAALEGALKYFLSGAVASALLVYGIALVYGATGSTNLRAIGAVTGKLSTEPTLLVGELLMIGALGFKVAAVPFHMWAPDAYQGAPTPVAAFMTTGVKAAGLAALVRLFSTAFGGDVLPFGRMGWASVLAGLAALTMTVANVAALRQENIKRMLAYSSVAHAGYLLVGVVASGIGAAMLSDPALLFYLLAYTLATAGAFAVVAWLGDRQDERLLLDDWAGLAGRHPAAAVAMTVFLLSLAGVPPTAGFFAKFYVLRAALAAPGGQLTWLVILAVLNSLVSLAYYLRPVIVMFFRTPAREPRPSRSPAVILALAGAALLVLAMGLFPAPWMSLAAASPMAR